MIFPEFPARYLPHVFTIRGASALCHLVLKSNLLRPTTRKGKSTSSWSRNAADPGGPTRVTWGRNMAT